MLSLSAVLLSLVVYETAAYKYQDVGKCPDIKGDPTFTLPSVTGKLRVIYATTSRTDATTDVCVTIKKGIFTITGADASITLMKFTSLKDLKDGAFTEVGPDGKNYKVIVLKTYDYKCGNMNLMVRCSTNGNSKHPQLVKVHTDYNVVVPDKCLDDAAIVARKALGNVVKLHKLRNDKCLTTKDICKK